MSQPSNAASRAPAVKSDQTRDHDRLAWRLSDILLRLNQGQELVVDTLAAEYQVHRRTVLRDLTERFAFLPIQKGSNGYSLDPAFLGRLNFADIKRFAALAGLKGLFPALDDQFVRELFDSRLQETLSIHGTSYEDLRERLQDFRTIQKAIAETRLLQFHYQKEERSKLVTAAPYRLINSSGIWYLAAVESGKPKAYAFAKLKAPQPLPTTYPVDTSVSTMLDAEDSIWLNTKKTEVILTVAAPAAPYFRRRKLIAQQTIEKELEDGGLIVSGKFAHPNQILPIVRYWLPNLRIVSPVGWQEELEASLGGYLRA